MKVKTGLLLGAAAALVGLAGGVLHSTTATPIEGAYAAATPQVGTTVTFESDQGFTAGTQYNQPEKASGKAGAQWLTYYGTPSTTSAISGKQSMQMRWYTGDPGNIGYTEMDYDVANVGSVEFKAKNTNGLNVLVKESVDGGAVWSEGQVITLSTQADTHTYTVTEANQGAEAIRFRFEISLPEKNPTSTSRLYLDDVAFYEPLSGANVSIATTSAWISKAAGVDATLTATALNVGDDATYAWSLADGDAEYAALAGEGASVTLSALQDVDHDVTVRVTATGSTGTATASATVSTKALLSVAEILEQGVKGETFVVAGYVVTDNTFGNPDMDYSQYEIADADISAAPVNGTTSIMLFMRGLADVKKGDFVIVSGSYTVFNGTVEIDDGYTIHQKIHDVEHLTDFVLASDVADQCNFKYEIAKAHFLGMTEEEKTTFKTSADTNIAAARERYEAWASAVGDTNAYEATTGAFNGNFGNDGMTYTIIALSSLLVISLAGVAVYFAIRKKKANKA